MTNKEIFPYDIKKFASQKGNEVKNSTKELGAKFSELKLFEMFGK